MLSEDIDQLISNFEKELVEFAKYVKTVEEEYNSFLPNKQNDTGKLVENESIFKEDDITDYNGIYEAIQITKNIMQKMYNLLDRFSNAVKINDASPTYPPSYLVNYFHEQYICQIVVYLLKLLEENLSIFTEKLSQTAESEIKFKVPEQCDVNEPVALKFKYFKPATLFTEDDKIYPFSRSTSQKPEIKRPTNHSKVSKPSAMSSEEDGDLSYCKFPECCERQKRNNLLLNNALKSLITVTEDVEELLWKFKIIVEARARSSPSESAADTSRGHEQNPEQRCNFQIPKSCPIENCRIGKLQDCQLCCESCKILLHGGARYKSLPGYKAYVRNTPIGIKKNRKKNNTRRASYNKATYEKNPEGNPTDNKEIISSQSKEDSSISSLEKEEKEVLQDYQDSSSRRAWKDDSLHTREDAIPSSASRDHNMLENLNTRSQTLVKENRKPPKPSTCPLKKNQSNDSNANPKFLTGDTVSKSGFLPVRGKVFKSSKSTSTNPEKLGLSSKDTLPKRNDFKSDDGLYPEVVVFNVKKFSHLLKEKFQKTEEKSESNLLLNIVVSSLQESSDFIYERGGKKEGDSSSSSQQGTDTEDDYKEKVDKALDNLVDGVIEIASLDAKSKIDSQQEVQEKEMADENENEDFDAPTSENDEYLKVMFPESSKLKKGLRCVTYACISCLNMENFTKKESFEETSPRIRKLPYKNTCFQCWYASQRGLTIHQCHTTIPTGFLEVRHMDYSNRINACFLKWDASKDPEDWRWMKCPYPDPTRVEVQEGGKHETDLVFKVVYGAESTMVKESIAETQLRTINDFPQMSSYKPESPINSSFALFKSDSMTLVGGSKERQKFGLRYMKPEHGNAAGPEIQLFNKLGRFFDDIQKFGYGKGPPLVLKLRQNSPLNDAYDLLMVPSKVRLHYYRDLRAIFVSDSKQINSNSNFVAEDKSKDLFELFTRKLFGTEAFHLFDYPSEEAHYMYLNPDTQTHPQWFTFAGTILALAFLHQKQMDIKFSKCLFKCLLDRPLVIRDLQNIDPLLYQKLMWLKEHDVSNQKLKMTFIIQDKVGNKTVDTELMANGRKIAVTEKNKYRYIELAVKWKLAERCLSQLKDFRRGFASVLDPCFLSKFSEDEISSILKHPPEAARFIPETSSGTKRLCRRETW